MELIDLLDMDENLEWIEELLDSAVRFSGNANDILQLCAIAYLKINQIDKAAELFRILVNESYNTVVNAQILSRLYVHKAIEQFDMLSRARYETLATRVNPDYLFHLPESWEQVDEKEIEEDFELKQVELLKNKYFAVIQYCLNEWSIRLGKLLPVPEKEKKYSDVYFSEKKKEQREKDMLELFSSKYKKNKRNDYLERLSHTGFLNAYFDEMNHFYGEISELYCLNERDKLQDIIKDSIVKNSSLITEQSRKIEEKKTDESDIGILLQLTSIATYSDFTRELKRQAEVGILGLPDLSKFAVADSALMNFCEKYGIPEPDILIEEGKDQELDSESMNQYFSLELLGENGIKLQKEHDRYKMTSEIIKKHADRMNGISEKSKVYFNDSVEFNTYFETGKLKNLRDIRQKTIAVYDDKSFQNADMLFTRDGVIPVVKNKVKEMIPYIMLGGERIKEEAKVLAHLQCYQNLRKDASVAEIFIPGLSAFNAGEAILDTKAIMNIIKVLQPMFDDICDEMIKTELEIYNKEK